MEHQTKFNLESLIDETTVNLYQIQINDKLIIKNWSIEAEQYKGNDRSVRLIDFRYQTDT